MKALKLNKNNLIGKVIALTLVSILVVGLTACGSEPLNTTSMYDLRTTMLDADPTLPDMLTVSSEDDNAAELFASLSDVDYDLIDSYFLSYSSEGLADEIAVVRVKKASDVDAVKASIDDHVQGRVDLYTSYDASQIDRAKGALVFVNNTDVILIISDNSSNVKAAYEEAIQ